MAHSYDKQSAYEGDSTTQSAVNPSRHRGQELGLAPLSHVRAVPHHKRAMNYSLRSKFQHFNTGPW
jgi:hypothetical protein